MLVERRNRSSAVFYVISLVCSGFAGGVGNGIRSKFDHFCIGCKNIRRMIHGLFMGAL